MEGEQVLRDMAAQQKAQLDSVPPEHLEQAYHFAHAYLMGATVALVNAGMLASATATSLLRDLLQPLEQPLVDTGTIERVSATLEGRLVSGIRRIGTER